MDQTLAPPIKLFNRRRPRDPQRLYTPLCKSVNILFRIAFINCFFRMHVLLAGLSSSDLGCLITLIWTNICYNPAFNDLDLPFSPIDFQYLTGTRLHIVFTRVTGCITAFITLERCLCVAMPLKVIASVS